MTGIYLAARGNFLLNQRRPLGEQVKIRQRQCGACRDPCFDKFPTIHAFVS